MAAHEGPREPIRSRRPRPVVRSALLAVAVVLSVVALLLAVLFGISSAAGPWFPKGGDGSMTTGAPQTTGARDTTRGPFVSAWEVSGVSDLVEVQLRVPPLVLPRVPPRVLTSGPAQVFAALG